MLYTLNKFMYIKTKNETGLNRLNRISTRKRRIFQLKIQTRPQAYIFTIRYSLIQITFGYSQYKSNTFFDDFVKTSCGIILTWPRNKKNYFTISIKLKFIEKGPETLLK